MNLHIRGGRLIDPSRRFDRQADLWVTGHTIGMVLEPDAPPPSRPDRELSAEGAIVAPGFVDLHVHFREPGEAAKEDIESGSKAAVAGGFTSVLSMPNTYPPNDSPEITQLILRRAREVAKCHVYPVGAITRGLAGRELAPLRALKEAGCLAFSDDGRPVNDAAIMRAALVEAKALGLFVIEHCEDLSLSSNVTVHAGEVAREWGEAGVPYAAETVDMARAVVLAAETGAHLHLAHLSCSASVDILRLFKSRCSNLTAEVTPHHLALTEDAVRVRGTNAKMYPPLREDSDRQALRAALADGTIDAVATDHAPHTKVEKSRPYADAPNGVIGLEFALPVLLRLEAVGQITMMRLIDALSTAPARIAGLPAGTLQAGAPADFVVFSPAGKRTLSEADVHSRSKNSPFIGEEGRGRVLHTFVGGREVFTAEPA